MTMDIKNTLKQAALEVATAPVVRALQHELDELHRERDALEVQLRMERRKACHLNDIAYNRALDDMRRELDLPAASGVVQRLRRAVRHAQEFGADGK